MPSQPPYHIADKESILETADARVTVCHDPRPRAGDPGPQPQRRYG